MWQALTLSECSEFSTLESAVQSTPWSARDIRELLEKGSLAWGVWKKMVTGSEVLIAAILLQPAGDTADILTLGVHPEYRRQGWGHQAVQCVISWAEDHQIESIFLEVRVSNHPAIALYKSCGFEMIHKRPNYYTIPHQQGIYEDAWIMRWQNLITGKK